MPNLDKDTVEGFGKEWARFHYRARCSRRSPVASAPWRGEDLLPGSQLPVNLPQAGTDGYPSLDLAFPG